MSNVSEPVLLGSARPEELDELARLAASCQADPERHCAYLGEDPDSIAADVAAVDAWDHATTVARVADRAVGWLLADVDADMGRVWWSGPFVEDPSRWDELADALYAHARAALPPAPEDGWLEEITGDARSASFAGFAARHGFATEEASRCLNLDPAAFTGSDTIDGRPVEVDGVTITPLSPTSAGAVAALHDLLFPGTHTTGDRIVAPDDPGLQRWAATDGDEVVGYVATERQHDDSLYIDFVGVDPDQRGRGIGRALVAHACRAGLDAGATFAHLTVRESITGARRLYESLGFRTERVIVPYRRRP